MRADIAIVVANWNGLHFLQPFLRSLEAQSHPPSRVIIVDNGSTDGSLAFLADWSGAVVVQVIALPTNTGFAHANNLGIDAALAAGAECVLTLNNDMELAPDCLEQLAQAMADVPDCAAYQILQINFFERDIIDGAGIGFSRWAAAFQVGYRRPLSELDALPRDLSGVIAGAACYRASALRDVQTEFGHFDRRFFAYYEDVDLSMRLRAKDHRFLLVPTARVFHVHSGTGINNSPFKTYYLTRNLFYYLRKNLTKRAFLAVLPYHIARTLRELAGHIRARRLDNVTSLLRGLAQGLLASPAGARGTPRLSFRAGAWRAQGDDRGRG